jgi:hypothetical protein
MNYFSLVLYISIQYELLHSLVLYISIQYELLHSLVLYPSMLTTFSHTRQTKTEFTVSHKQVGGGSIYSCPLRCCSELRTQRKGSGLTYICC